MKIAHFILIFVGSLSAILTYLLQFKYKQSAVRASALVGVFSALFVLLFPNVLTNYLSQNIPLVCFGASFIGMVSSKLVKSYWIISVSGAIFTILYLNTSSFFAGFGGGLGSAACIALLVTLAIPIVVNKGNITNGFLQLKRLINKQKIKK
ncbi:hypothetical protein Q4599_15180 [Cellulophaga lytica]|uniref:hypothetical protein n=1 Tax=Cellulophaga lytica TaxID=979 RepID=UPI0026E31F32|nr:hypothetical protein [Cellulophaga lytica]MDO6854932.1 hypothetical protein [Cellulophaga lytica]